MGSSPGGTLTEVRVMVNKRNMVYEYNCKKNVYKINEKLSDVGGDFTFVFSRFWSRQNMEYHKDSGPYTNRGSC